MKPVLIAPPYTGPGVVCTQCGHSGAGTRSVQYAGLGPALQRTCSRCGHVWTERPTANRPAATGQYV